MQKHVLKLAMAISLGVAIACGSDKATGPQNITYIANLKASNEVLQNGSSAGVNSPATGTWTGTLNPTTNVLTWTMTFSGLTANSSASHIHAQAPTTTTASVVLNFATFAASTSTLGGTPGTATRSMSMPTQAAPPHAPTISADP